MLRLILLLLSGQLLFTSSVFGIEKSDSKIEVKEIDFFNSEMQRPIKVRVWHQHQSKECQTKICLTDTQNPSSIAVLSHGAFGSPRSMNWLGYGLAAQGWLVLGVAHYGESWIYGRNTIDRNSVMRWWQRPQDIKFVLDSINTSGYINKTLQTNNVLAIGHSAGGFTALSLAGAQLSHQQSLDYCQSQNAQHDRSCGYASTEQLKALTTQLSEIGKIQQTLKDSRITTVVALDPALGHAATETSLKSIDIPTLVVGSVDNDFLIYKHHAANYGKTIPSAQLIPVRQKAGHFVYLDSCNHNHKALGVSLCKDREGVDREKIQREVLTKINDFLNQFKTN